MYFLIWIQGADSSYSNAILCMNFVYVNCMSQVQVNLYLAALYNSYPSVRVQAVFYLGGVAEGDEYMHEYK